MKTIELQAGQRFGRLVVIGRSGSSPVSRNATFLCRCDCGRETVKPGSHLRSGHTQSCGCFGEVASVTHGESGRAGRRSPEYSVWAKMIGRCTNPREKRWADYGGRGIQVCERWRQFENFRADMGDRPAGMTIERIDNNGNYAPSNCRWATDHEQKRNMRSNVNLTFNGRTMCATDWARELGMRVVTLHCRIRRGWSTERALTSGVKRAG
jgi:hypothetical protein